MIDRSTDVRSAQMSRQRGFLLNPFRFGGGGGGGPPPFSSVSLLMHMNGVNAGTTFTDASTNAHTVSRFGNAQTSTPFKKFGTASLALDGTGDYLTVPANSVFNMGSDDFTLEFWVWISVLGSGAHYMLGQGNNAADQSSRSFIVFAQGAAAAKRISLALYDGTTTLLTITGTTNMAATTWYHVAATRHNVGGTRTTRLFLEGNLEGSSTTAGALNSSASPLGIGRFGTFTGGGDTNGYIDELRITKGYARYTAAFTPPSAEFPNS